VNRRVTVACAQVEQVVLDPSGHEHRPDMLELGVGPSARAAGAPAREPAS